MAGLPAPWLFHQIRAARAGSRPRRPVRPRRASPLRSLGGKWRTR
ncbi:hypothetical protein ACP70R_037947 [Stipagrostis hirtigluma subsp. patula]